MLEAAVLMKTFRR